MNPDTYTVYRVYYAGKCYSEFLNSHIADREIMEQQAKGNNPRLEVFQRERV